MLGAPEAWGLYVHIPFCPYRCHYCDFVAVAAGPRVAARVPDYLAAVRAEAIRLSERLRPEVPPASVYYGGGTPTVVPARALAALHQYLSDLFGVPADAEVTVEANPDTVDRDALAALRQAGVNRLSVGMQAWQDRLLRRLGRAHGGREAALALEAARDAGFDNVNLDLMYGLPGQTLADWEETLERALALAPEHVSAYGLQVEPGTVLFRRLGGGAAPPGVPSGDWALPGEEAEAEMYARAREVLARAGYRHYEVSNWARDGRRCRHNLLYWRNQDYLGLGLGAASHWRGRRWRNVGRLTDWRPEPEPEAEEVDTVVLGLRLVEEGVTRAGFRRRFGRELDAVYGPQIRRLTAAGLLADEGDRIRLTRRGLELGNQVFVAFV